MNAEFVRSLNCNYKRILLDEKPNEKKYQYVILDRGGIKGLLKGGLQYIDGNSYLYYDVSSKQSLVQLMGKRKIDREWVLNFVRNYRQLDPELNRFLLDIRHIIWDPENIFQEIDSQELSFMYVPYYEENTGLMKFCEFLVEHVDYNDDALVECVYLIYEHAEQMGDTYFKDRLYKDTDCLRQELPVKKTPEILPYEEPEPALAEEEPAPENRKSLFGLFEGRKKKNREVREEYKAAMQKEMNSYMVAEDSSFPTQFGKTLYIEETASEEEKNNKICRPSGEVVFELEGESCTIGKKKEEVDLVLEDYSVSRIHARISRTEEGLWALEDLNSTNGTFKNGLRLKPYEKKELKSGDEIKIGRIILVFE